jgi:tRNA pseudouridine55 synthase
VLPSGALLIDKPVGVTSSDVVSKLKWNLTRFEYAPKGFRIGHGGTLDPFATGALVVFIGEGTKLADTYLHSVKTYDGIISLGTQTDSGDLTGEIKAQASVPEITESAWQTLADSFVENPYQQTPPMFSAKKKDGTPLYELAREGIEIERESILKKIHTFKIKKTSDAHELFFEVKCESGTYVRVIASDLAEKASTLAHLKTLRRTQTSDVDLSACMSLAEAVALIETKTPLQSFKNFRTLANLASHISEISIDLTTTEFLFQGRSQETLRLGLLCQEKFSEARYVIAKYEGIPVALFENLKGRSTFRLQRIFNEARTVTDFTR